MTKKRRGLLADIVCLAAIFVWLGVYSYPYFFESLSSNYRLIQTYNLDSMVMLRAVEEGLLSRWLRLRFIEYGHFYFNAVMVTATIISLFQHISEWTLVFILRFYALIGGCCTIAITYAFAKRYLGRLYGVFAAAILAFSPLFVEFSNEVKPDSWQIFFMILSLYFLARAFEATGQDGGGRLNRPLRADFTFVLAASAAAGAAFGTKYEGVLLIPLLAVATWFVAPVDLSDRFFARATRFFLAAAAMLGIGLAWLGRIAYPLNVMIFLRSDDAAGEPPFALHWEIQAFRVGCFLASALCFAALAAYVAGFDFSRARTALARRILIWISVGLAFAAAFAVSSPWLLYHFQFLPNLYQRNDTAGAGNWFGFQWLAMIFGTGSGPELYFVHAVGALSIVGAVLLLAALPRRAFRATNFPFLIVLGFALIFIALLVIKINFVTSLYPLPAIPPLVLLAAFALHELCGALPRWLGQRGAALGAVALSGLLIVTQAWAGGSQLLKYPLLVTSLSPGNRMLGDWLSRCVPHDAMILAAGYSYVPPDIKTMAVNWGPDYRYLVSNNPDIVILNVNDTAIAAAAAAKPGFVPSSFIDRFYAAMFHRETWRPGPTFMPYRVYVKTRGRQLNPACR